MLGTIRDTWRSYGRWAIAEIQSRYLSGRPSSAGETKSALLLAHYLPPDVSGGVYRPLSWLQYGSRSGWRMAAVASRSASQVTAAGAHLQKAIPESVSISRFQPGHERPSWRFFPRIDGGFLNALRMFETARQTGQRPSVIIATGPSFYTFVAGLFLSRFWRVPLVLDYRDEWTECPFAFVAPGNMDRYWEGRCLAHADRVIFTTRAQREFRQKLFGRLAREKCYVVPNGWEPADWHTIQHSNASRPRRQKADRKLRISYVGTLSDHASPSSFLSSLRLLLATDEALRERLEITFIGHCSDSAREVINSSGLADLVTIVGEIPRPEANQAMLEADLLLLIALPALQRYIPGKLYEYVASGRSVLVYGHEGEVSRLVREIGVGAFVQEGDSVGLREVILRRGNDSAASENSGARQRWLEQHSRAALAGALFGIIEDMLRERGLSLPESAGVLDSAST